MAVSVCVCVHMLVCVCVHMYGFVFVCAHVGVCLSVFVFARLLLSLSGLCVTSLSAWEDGIHDSERIPAASV